MQRLTTISRQLTITGATREDPEMEPMTAVVIVMLALLFLIAIETPIGVSLGASGVIGLLLLHDLSYSLSVLGSSVFTSTSSYSLVIIPMFILMGMFAVQARLAEQVYAVANRAFRHLPGGLACASVGACAGFAAVTGSSVATAATMARLAVSEMMRYGYAPHFAAGVLASSGTLGIMIPPSIILVLYSILTGESTGQMLAAGIIPGLLSAASYMFYILWRGRRYISHPDNSDESGFPTDRPDIEATGVASVSDQQGAPRNPSPRDMAAADKVAPLPYRGIFRIVLLFLIILGGIYSGIFTATESGALASLAALVIMLLERRREKARRIFGFFSDAAAETAETTSMIFLIVVGSAVFSTFLVSSGLPQLLANGILSLEAPPLLIVALILLLMVPLGMVLESISILIITMPLLYPIVDALGFSGVWFGILVVKMIEIGLITPPVGISAYVVAGSVPGLRVEQVFRGVVPFIAMDALVVAILFAVPSLVTWLPDLAK